MNHLRILNILFLSILFLVAKGQQNYFAYFQSSDGNPFQLLYKNKSISSSSNGYAILPQLTNGEHTVVFRFTSASNSEIAFNIFVDNKDQGFKIIKNGKEHSLFNFITLNQILPNSLSSTISSTQKTPAVTSEPTTIPVIKTEPTTVSTTKTIEEPSLSNVPSEKSTNNNTHTQAAINVSTIDVSSEGQFLQYIISETDFNDTITIFMPNASSKSSDSIASTISKKITAKAASNEPEFLTNIEAASLPAPTNKTTEISENEKANISPEQSSINQSSASSNEPQLRKIKLINSDCKKLADNNDLVNLRVKLASQDDPKALTEIAQKAFKQKCYTTEQIKKLSVLFITDADKMNFFIEAYPFVYDSEEFRELHTQFKSPDYVSKFKKMTNQQ
jgi:hypothetical protein